MLKWFYCKINRLTEEEYQMLEDMVLQNYENECREFMPVFIEALDKVKKGEESVTIDVRDVDPYIRTDVRKILYRYTSKLKVSLNGKYMTISRR